MGFPVPGAGLGLTCAAVTSALPGPSSGAPAQWFGSGMENELTRGEQPACTSGGEAFYTVKQAMPLKKFFFLQLVCSLGAGRALARERLPAAAPRSPMAGDSERQREFSLAVARSDWSVLLLCISPRVRTVLSSAVSRSSGDCISGS